MSPPNHEYNSSNPTTLIDENQRVGVYPKIIEPFSENNINNKGEINSNSVSQHPQSSINSSQETSAPRGSTDGLYSSDGNTVTKSAGQYEELRWKGWKGMSPLEKSLSVSLGICSTICVALMIAIIIIGVRLNNDCKTVINPTTPLPITTVRPTQPARCEVTTRPRPPRRGSGGGVTQSSIFDVREENPFIPKKMLECISSDQYNASICFTPECFNKASQIIESMNFEINPCDDFYEFACGNWVKRNPVPSYTQMWTRSRKQQENLLLQIKDILESDQSTSTRSFDLAQKFYHSCMHPTDDEVGLAEVRLLADMSDNFDNTMDPLTYLASVLPNVRSDLNGNFIVSLEVDVDDKNITENAIYLDRPSFGLSSALKTLESENSYKEQDKAGLNPDTLSLYKDFVRKLWLLAFPQDSEKVDVLVNEMLEFESSLRNINPMNLGVDADPDVILESLEVESLYNPLSEVAGVQITSSMASWLKELTKSVLLQVTPEGETGESIEASYKIIVKDLEYFRNLELKLTGTTTETIKNYLQLRILLDYGPQGGKLFADLFSEFKNKVFKTSLNNRSRWQVCSEQTNNLFGWTISFELLKDSFPEIDLQFLNETANYVKSSLIKEINELPWIAEDYTRQSALQKVHLMDMFLGYPSWLQDKLGTYGNPFVENFYSDMNFTESSNYLQNYIEIQMWLSKKILAEVFDPIMMEDYLIDEWPAFVYPSQFNSFYLDKLNYLVLPVGSIDRPFQPIKEVDFVPSFVYGSFGVLAAKNMLNAIDDRGRLRNANGTLGNWWDNETIANYEYLNECFLNQTTISDDGESDASSVTQQIQEITLSNGALNLAYQAYRSQLIEDELNELLLPGLQDLSPQKLFFLSFAQAQCSADKRPDGFGQRILQSITKNSVEFAKQWNCPLPSRDDTCRIF